MEYSKNHKANFAQLVVKDNRNINETYIQKLVLKLISIISKSMITRGQRDNPQLNYNLQLSSVLIVR